MVPSSNRRASRSKDPLATDEKKSEESGTYPSACRMSMCRQKAQNDDERSVP